MSVIQNLNNIDLHTNNHLINFIQNNKPIFVTSAIFDEFLKVAKTSKNSTERLGCFGCLWYYSYTFTSKDIAQCVQDIGYSNFFLFWKQTVQDLRYKQIAKLITTYVFDKYFIKTENENGIPFEMVRDDIWTSYGILQWFQMCNPDKIPKIIDYLNKLTTYYPKVYSWKWLDKTYSTSINKNIVYDNNHYINQSNVFTLFYGLYLTEWVYYSINMLKINKTDLWVNKLNDFKVKLENNNLSLLNFLKCLMFVQKKWNPKENTHYAWLVNHIPYFLSAFYEYDLSKIKIKPKSDLDNVIKFIKHSYKYIKSSSWDYYGECVEILEKLGYHILNEKLTIQNLILHIDSRNKILKYNTTPFSDVHTIVTFVIFPNIMGSSNPKLTKHYGKYVAKIIKMLNKTQHSKRYSLKKYNNINSRSKKNKLK